jgi:hypothetical protein
VNPSTQPPAQQAPGEEKKPKAAKPKKEKKEGATIPRPRLPKFPDEHVITVLRPNAKRGASADRYNQYRTGMTVKEYVTTMTGEPWKRTVGEVFADMRWDTDPNRKLIHIGPEVVPVPAPQPKAEATPTKSAA